MDNQRDAALKVLGVPVDSDRATVTSAYRRLARSTHPDVSPDPDAAEKFATVAAAYRVVCGVPLSEPRLPAADAPRSTYPMSRRPGRIPPGMSPFAPARSWWGPPIVAGPVLVHWARPEAGGSVDG